MMALREMAALLIDGNTTDWPSIAAMLAILVGVSTAVAALINGMLIKPMIDKAKKEIMEAMVSKEVFRLFADNDRQEHEEMKDEIRRLSNNGRLHR